MNQDQLEILLTQIGYDLQELKEELTITREGLKEHIKQFDAHKEPIQLPRWMIK